MFLAFVGFIPYAFLMQLLVPESWLPLAGLLYLVAYLFLILSFYGFVCPNCGKSLYVLLYIGKFPLLTKNWVSRNCTHCGARLK